MKRLPALVIMAVVTTIGLVAAAPGGLKAHQAPLGACGIALGLLGIGWAARRDGLAAIGYDPAAGREWAPLSPIHSLARALSFFAGFLGLALLIQWPGVQSLETGFLHRCYQCGSPACTRVMHGISHAAGGHLLTYGIPLAIAALWVGGRARSLRFFLAAMFGTFGLEGVFKSLVHRARPDLVSGRYFNSFPSGHTLAATILAGALLLICLPLCRRAGQRRLLWSAAVVWVGLIAAARVYLGTHYLTDVAGGILLGVAWIYGCHGLLLRWARPSIPHLHPAALDPDHKVEGRTSAGVT